jgi:hypothetical protein
MKSVLLTVPLNKSQINKITCTKFYDFDLSKCLNKRRKECFPIPPPPPHGGTPKRVVRIPRSPYVWNRWQAKKCVSSARRLFQQHQLTDRNSRDIARDVWNVSRYFKSFTYLSHDLSWNHWVPQNLHEEAVVWSTVSMIFTHWGISRNSQQTSIHGRRGSVKLHEAISSTESGRKTWRYFS